MELGLETAREAGALALSYFQRAQNGELQVTTKGTQDWLSEADGAVEMLIRKRFAEHFPDDGFFGEETGSTGFGQGTWVVDPIDGTANFVRGINLWCISIAYYQPDGAKLGFIYEPVEDRMYSARSGAGAFCNGQPIRVSGQADPERSLVILGYSHSIGVEPHLDTIKRLARHHTEYRRLGSAALALSLVAAGRVEAYYEMELNSWDCLAGLLLVQEAGGVCTPFASREFIEKGGLVLGCNAAFADHLYKLFEIGA